LRKARDHFGNSIDDKGAVWMYIRDIEGALDACDIVVNAAIILGVIAAVVYLIGLAVTFILSVLQARKLQLFERVTWNHPL
jgi:hypothetical protein